MKNKERGISQEAFAGWHGRKLAKIRLLHKRSSIACIVLMIVFMLTMFATPGDSVRDKLWWQQWAVYGSAVGVFVCMMAQVHVKERLIELDIMRTLQLQQAIVEDRMYADLGRRVLNEFDPRRVGNIPYA